MKTITIVSVSDVVQALAAESLHKVLYFVDNHKVGGSQGQGTEFLHTAAQKGDRIVWITQALEVETFMAIENILIDKSFIEPKKEFYEGTDISFWSGILRKDPGSGVPYRVAYTLGSRATPMLSPEIKTPALIQSNVGDPTGTPENAQKS